ncbi:hypothetical protein DACRYDRAFT_107015 [Dacryopinax primogenitus]|uniref:Uncharacterized protein n=1 Tax=Dacryopinax primogenitus (strain DJM 731) TaxID=1858805 RepID=M5FZX9_DACPD|nr:uncharacterized protein DACRYDRAFT_107015 [Dacryopinax primogenitus]EJU02064.1 hypothetical protein DACRYDRAFT_107015 [Dacryopinax primogenitus]
MQPFLFPSFPSQPASLQQGMEEAANDARSPETVHPSLRCLSALLLSRSLSPPPQPPTPSPSFSSSPSSSAISPDRRRTNPPSLALGILSPSTPTSHPMRRPTSSSHTKSAFPALRLPRPTRTSPCMRGWRATAQVGSLGHRDAYSGPNRAASPLVAENRREGGPAASAQRKQAKRAQREEQAR